MALSDVSLNIKRPAYRHSWPERCGKDNSSEVAVRELSTNLRYGGSRRLCAGLNEYWCWIPSDFTGMENIKASLLYNGLGKQEFEEAVVSILDFCELGEFIDQPFKNYSLGMQSRLMFARNRYQAKYLNS